MKKLIQNIWRKISTFFKKFLQNFKPSKTGVNGAAYALMLLSAFLLFITGIQTLPYLGWFISFVFIIAVIAISILLGLLVDLAIKLLGRIPVIFRISMVMALMATLLSFGMSTNTGIALFIYFLLFCSFAGGAIWIIVKKQFITLNIRKKLIVLFFGLIGLAGIGAATIWVISPGDELELPEIAALSGEYMPEHINAEDPGARGNFNVLHLTYGSGEDKNRNEYSENVEIITEPVDGSSFVNGWSGFSGSMRTKHFGFDLKSLPRNAMVWYPEGNGPFPLVLIVHGNHLAQDYSEPGYRYLGELLASRGFILASVDQNYLNGSYTDLFGGIKGENDARGWMLLEHLNLWKEWNNDSTNIFFEKVDMENISLIGHSRGGEAVAHAALFNKIPYYPDNGTIEFDYNFNIKSVVAIAPSDAQYQPSGARTTLEDVSYLVLHGSHDADVQSYMGMRQYERATFSEDFAGFKAAIYIYNANHGQFNSVWGRKDYPSPRINLLNLKQLMPKEEQEKIAKTFISAFLEVTLKNNEDYLALLKDYRTGIDWLPHTIYVNRFDKAGMQYICSFTEDFDITTTTLHGGNIETENLTVWRESMVNMKWGNKGTRAAFIGWNNNENEGLTACYSINFPKESVNTDSNSYLFFSLADSGGNSNPNPKSKDAEEHNDNDTIPEPKIQTNEIAEEAIENEEEAEENDTPEERGPIDFSIEIADANGEVIKFKLSDHAFLQEPVRTKMHKLSFMRTEADTEHLYQFYHFPVKKFLDLNPNFNPKEIVKVSLIFDQAKYGVIILDHLGFM